MLGMRVLSELVQRSWLGRMAGLTFQGNRDLYSTLGYKDALSVDDFRARYRRGGLAKRIVEALPNATWRGGSELIEDEDPEVSTEFEEAFGEMDKRLSIWSTLRRLDILAGQGEYAVMVIGAPGDLAAPLPKVVPAERISYLTLYGQDEAKVVEVEKKETDPRYGQPTFYDIARRSRRSALVGIENKTRRVHHSRVLHVADGIVDDPLYGIPRLEAVWNDLDNLDKVIGGGAEAFWQRVHQGYHFNLEKDLEIDEEDAEELKAQVLEMTHNMRRVLMTRGMQLEVLGSDVANFMPQADAILNQIAGTTEIPKRILMGSERGELASSQDKTNWDERIMDRRTEWAEPRVVRPMVALLQGCGALPLVEEWSVRWPEGKKMTEKERAEIANIYSSLSKNAGEPVITGAEIRDRVLEMDPLTEEQLGEIEERKQQALADQQAMFEAQAKAKGGQVDEKDADNEDDEKPGPRPVPFAPRAAAGGPRRDRSFRRIHEAADAHRGQVSKVLQAAINAGKRALDPEAIELAIHTGSYSRVEGVLSPVLADLAGVFGDVDDALLECLGDAGTAAANAANRSGLRANAAGIGLSFDRTNPEAVKWARTRSASLVSYVSDATRAAVRRVIARAFDQHVPPTATARLLRAIVGLTEDQTDAVFNLRSALERSPGRLVYAGKLRFRVPAGGASEEYIQRACDRYASKLLTYRTESIARTETIAASNEGQRQLWKQAVEAGELDGDEGREWVAAVGSERTCPICSKLDGQVVGLEEKFVTVDGDRVLGPPAHPMCRCATVLSFAKVRARAADATRDADFKPTQPRDKQGQWTDGGGGAGGGAEAGGGLPTPAGQVDFFEMQGGKRVQLSRAEVDAELVKTLGPRGPAMLSDALGIGEELFPGGHHQMLLRRDFDVDPGFKLSTFGPQIQGENGKPTRGAIARSYTSKKYSTGAEVHVEHEIFTLPKAQQGSGAASKMMASSLEAYERNGVRKINVHANIDVGGYAWAKQGFRLTSGYGPNGKEAAKEFLDLSGAKAGIRRATKNAGRREELLQGALKAGYNAPSWLAGQPEGKKVLLKSDWTGYLDLGSSWGQEAKSSIVAKAKAKKS
jgi:hypothetical protein